MRHWNGKETPLYLNRQSGYICEFMNPTHPDIVLLNGNINEALTVADTYPQYTLCGDHYGKHTEFAIELRKLEEGL